MIVDYFTKWVTTVPLKSKEGREVAEAIYKYQICQFGIPFEIHTDQGPEFCNDLA